METIGASSCCSEGGAILTRLDGMAGRRFALFKPSGNYVCGRKERNITMNQASSVDPTGLNDFGYDSGRNYTLEQFRQMADRFEVLRAKGMTIPEKENEYWRIVTSGDV